MMRQWRHMVQHLLLTLIFCLLVAWVQYFFSQTRPFSVKLVYSFATGVPIWAVVEFGRFWLAKPPDHSWPRGWRGPALVVTGILTGFFTSTVVGDWWFGWSSWDQSQDQIVGGAVVTVLAGAVASGFFYLQGRSIALKSLAEAAERQAAESRLKLLQSQLDPHMLFNTLANLRSLIHSDPQRATAMLDRLNDYLRATLSASRTTTHSLSAEFDRLRDYLELMAIRMGPRLRFSLELPSELADIPVPTLLLQPLVENSIKHGLEPSVAGGWVEVRGWLDDEGALRLDVMDSGTGLLEAVEPCRDPGPRATDADASPFGLAQVRERLATQYGAAAQLSFAAAPGRQGSAAPAQVAAIRIAPPALGSRAKSAPIQRIGAPVLPT